jgi:hypothetical protein
MQLTTGPQHHSRFHAYSDFVPLLLTFAFWIAVLVLVLLASR